MKRFFGFLLFILGAAASIFTVAAFFAMGYQNIFLASIVVSIFLLVFGFILSYEPEEKLSQEELNAYRKNGSISKRLGQL